MTKAPVREKLSLRQNEEQNIKQNQENSKNIKEHIQPLSTEPKEQYYPDNIWTAVDDLAQQLRQELMPRYRDNHEPSARCLALALQEADIALKEVNPYKLEISYRILQLFRS